MKAIAIDDEPPALKVIEHFCQKLDYIDLERSFTSPSEALKYLRKFPVDLVFLDIQMPGISGIEFVKAIGQNSMIIFTTGHSQYAVESYNLNAVDYLLKPFAEERFQIAASKAAELFQFSRQSDAGSPPHFFVRADYSLIRIDFADILFVEGLDDYLKIHLSNQKTIVTRMTLKSMLEKLPSKEFCRVHRSYIVPLERIRSVKNKTIIIGEEEIPIGSSFESEFLKSLGGES